MVTKAAQSLSWDYELGAMGHPIIYEKLNDRPAHCQPFINIATAYGAQKRERVMWAMGKHTCLWQSGDFKNGVEMDQRECVVKESIKKPPTGGLGYHKIVSKQDRALPSRLVTDWGIISLRWFLDHTRGLTSLYYSFSSCGTQLGQLNWLPNNMLQTGRISLL